MSVTSVVAVSRRTAGGRFIVGEDVEKVTVLRTVLDGI